MMITMRKKKTKEGGEKKEANREEEKWKVRKKGGRRKRTRRKKNNNADDVRHPVHCYTQHHVSYSELNETASLIQWGLLSFDSELLDVRPLK